MWTITEVALRAVAERWTVTEATLWTVAEVTLRTVAKGRTVTKAALWTVTTEGATFATKATTAFAVTTEGATFTTEGATFTTEGATFTTESTTTFAVTTEGATFTTESTATFAVTTEVATRSTTETAAFATFWFKGFAFFKTCNNTEFGFFFRFEVSCVEFVVFFFLSFIVFASSNTWLEDLLSANKLSATLRIDTSQRYFFRGKELSCTWFQITAPKGADANADELLNAKTEAGEHLTYLTLQTLFQHNRCAACGEAGNVLSLGLTFWKAKTLEQLYKYRVVEVLVKCDPVFLFNATTWVSYFLAESSLVSHDDQAFTVGVKTTNIVSVAELRKEEVINSTLSTLCFAAANKATWLVEQEYDFFHRGGAAAINLDEVGREYTNTWGVDGLAVYFYTTFCNQAVGSAA